ncbi:Aste57867_14654 [Aphanomyces stellatus]|uniref:COX assembly mitochondrial protein n=1 Tax=Aphanomyces stellatus TaxID=120398 RepID=A0A485L188_9STRA|nr:hypothetical protein As57867_014599 [Aphanomyces stellatus]VFT91473.1 Aste57867_14654 [Aphanomyces stellatus]
MSDEKKQVPTIDEAKTEWRTGRLTWSNQAENKVKQELNAIALANCRDKTAAFVECSKEHGMMVVFKCREQNRILNECLHEYTSKEALEALKANKMNEIPVVVKQVPVKKYFEQ